MANLVADRKVLKLLLLKFFKVTKIENREKEKKREIEWKRQNDYIGKGLLYD